VDFRGPKGDQAFDFPCLVLGIQVEVDARRHLHSRANTVEGDVRPDAVLRTQQHEIVVVAVPRLIVERRSPELRLALQVVHPENDRADANHPRLSRSGYESEVG